MVISGILDSNQQKTKIVFSEETSSEVYRKKLLISLCHTSTHFSWYGKSTRIHELRTFGCDIYPITSSPKNLYDRTQELSLMGYTNSRATIKWRDPHTKKIKTFHIPNFMNTTINLENYSHQVLN